MNISPEAKEAARNERCVANWFIPNGPDDGYFVQVAINEALKHARNNSICIHHSDTERSKLESCPVCAINSAIAPLEKKIEELELRLKLRQERIITHSDRCHLWHIDCAISRLEETAKEICILKKIESHANEKLSNSNHHSVFESIDDAALTLIDQRKEIARLRGEVEKAFYEGCRCGFSRGQSGLSVSCSESDYLISRAKRVAEGKE